MVSNTIKLHCLSNTLSRPRRRLLLSPGRRALVLEPAAPALDLHHVGVVQQPADQRGGESDRSALAPGTRHRSGRFPSRISATPAPGAGPAAKGVGVGIRCRLVRPAQRSWRRADGAGLALTATAASASARSAGRRLRSNPHRPTGNCRLRSWPRPMPGTPRRPPLPTADPNG